MTSKSEGVFINVPFDRKYKKLFDALVCLPFMIADSSLAVHGNRTYTVG
jgi:hypothetical protein